MATYTDNYNLTKPTFAESADIRTINGNMDTIDAVMHASQVSLADAYDETRTASNPYKTGDIVMYELLMYKCLEDGVYGTWDGTKWERTTAGANGGGSDVEVTPSYNSGTKIAEIDVDGNTEEIYVPEMTGASSQADGTAGLPPAPEAGDEGKVLYGDGSWKTPTGGVEYVELTQAQYDALSPAEKMNGKMYFITDGNADTASGRSGYSETVIYENAGSTQASSMTLTDDIAKYDLILFEAYVSDDNRIYTVSNIYRASTIISGWNTTLLRWSPSNQYINLGYVSSTEITCYSSSNMYIKRIVGLKYIGGSSGGSGDNDDLSEKTWNLITSTTGTSAEIDIPSGTEWLVLTAEMSGRVSEVGKERMSNINKLMDVAQLTIWGKGYEWADTLGNHTTISMAVNGGKVSIKSGYNTVTAKVYAVS